MVEALQPEDKGYAGGMTEEEVAARYYSTYPEGEDQWQT